MIGLHAPGPVSYGAIGTVEFIKAIIAVITAPIIPDKMKAKVNFGMERERRAIRMRPIAASGKARAMIKIGSILDIGEFFFEFPALRPSLEAQGLCQAKERLVVCFRP